MANHAAITGPNRNPTAPLPFLWIANNATRITAADGTTYGVTAGSAISSPSTALSTEMAGVIMASPKNSDAPASPTTSKTP